MFVTVGRASLQVGLSVVAQSSSHNHVSPTDAQKATRRLDAELFCVLMTKVITDKLISFPWRPLTNLFHLYE